MQKPGLIVVASGALIVIGLILSILGNQVIFDGFNQENGKVSSSQDIIISVGFDSQETSTGVFVVQIIGFKENTISANILDPLEIEIVSLEINEESIQKEFDVLETGNYKLIIHSNSDEEIQVEGAIGPTPDPEKQVLYFVSGYVIIAGMIGLAIMAIYMIKNRKRSI